jgi:hypothetical protein
LRKFWVIFKFLSNFLIEDLGNKSSDLALHARPPPFSKEAFDEQPPLKKEVFDEQRPLKKEVF